MGELSILGKLSLNWGKLETFLSDFISFFFRHTCVKIALKRRKKQTVVHSFNPACFSSSDVAKQTLFTPKPSPMIQATDCKLRQFKEFAPSDSEHTVALKSDGPSAPLGPEPWSVAYIRFTISLSQWGTLQFKWAVQVVIKHKVMFNNLWMSTMLIKAFPFGRLM